MGLLGTIGMLTVHIKSFGRKPAAENEPKLSFIVAVWNEGDRVRKCVESIIGQNYPKNKIRVIVVGGGDERTVAVCRVLQNQGKIHYIHEKERRGKWFALNTALKLVKDDYVAFTDADCVLERGWLRKMLSHDSDIVITDIYSLSESSLLGKFYTFILQFGPRLSESASPFLRTGEFSGIGSVVKREVFGKVRFKNNLVEDWAFVSDAKRRGFTVEHSDARAYEHTPKTLNDLRKGSLRVVKGFLSGGASIGAHTSLSMVMVSIISAVSIPLYAYQLFNLDQFSLLMMLAALASTASLFFVSAWKYDNYRLVFYAPFVIPLTAIVGLFSIETMLKVLAKQKIEWEIYDKV